MARKTEDFLMIFLGVLMIGQYSNVQAEDYEGPLSVAEEEVLGKNAMADVEAESADAVSEPLRDPFWPVGYRPGLRLSDYWALDESHLGEETFTHWPDGSAHKNRMQGNDYIQSQMYVKGVSCSGCHDAHGTEFEADLIMPATDLCLTCHQPQLQPGPAASVTDHTRHAIDSEGSQCVACHMPEIARTVGTTNVRSHTFKFISPALTEQHGIPNPCTTCHSEETNAWALNELRQWEHVSPWRVAP